METVTGCGHAANANLVASVTTPIGLKNSKTCDSQGRLLATTVLNAQLSTINSCAYTYDAAGQRNTEAASTGKRDFTSDAFRQLTQSVKSGNATETDRHSYTFDTIGNRLTSEISNSQNPNPALTTYTPNAVNQYAAITGALADTPGYDANGNTTSTQGMASPMTRKTASSRLQVRRNAASTFTMGSAAGWNAKTTPIMCSPPLRVLFTMAGG
jgi:hypothetical protein